MTHLHISSIPERVSVRTTGMVRMQFTDNGAFGNICDERGQTTQRFEQQPTLLSVAIYSDQAVEMVGAILKSLPAHERARAIAEAMA